MSYKLSHYQKVRLLNYFSFILVIYMIIINSYNTTLLISSLIFSWILQGLGVCITLHKLCTHNSFKPRNNIIKNILLTLSCICSVGSPVSWASIHRLHHAYSDTKLDPTNPSGSFLHAIKNFFSHYKIPDNGISIKDLLLGKSYKFFHVNYFKIILLYIITLYIINPILVVYFYAIPVCFNVICMGWASTLSHKLETSIIGYRNFNTNDNTYNSLLWQLITMGEGLHNNHHALPQNANTAVKCWEFDISYFIIKLLGVNK